MATTPDPEKAAEGAHEMLAARVALVRDAATALAAHERAKEAAEAAERDFVAAYRAAISGGWTEAELRKVGLTPPRRRAPGRPRRSATGGGSETPAGTASN